MELRLWMPKKIGSIMVWLRSLERRPLWLSSWSSCACCVPASLFWSNHYLSRYQESSPVTAKQARRRRSWLSSTNEQSHPGQCLQAWRSHQCHLTWMTSCPYSIATFGLQTTRMSPWNLWDFASEATSWSRSQSWQGFGQSSQAMVNQVPWRC